MARSLLLSFNSLMIDKNITPSSLLKSRRLFLKAMLMAGSWPILDRIGSLGNRGSKGRRGASAGIVCKYRTMSVEHFPELQEDVDNLRRGGRLSRNAIYRKYIDKLKFRVPESFQQAKSLIILATSTPAMETDFHYRGKAHRVTIPPQYYDDGITLADLTQMVRTTILKDPKAELEYAKGIHLKLTAVRSGLGRYGSNNICFVDGLGTFLTLHAFFTDRVFPEDHWGPIAMLEACRECTICYGICPTNAIVRENFVIDAGRCISLYNETDGEFPPWILPAMHNALMGCMKCQSGCPENEKAPPPAGRLEDVTEDETAAILAGKPDQALLASLNRKLRGFSGSGSPESFPILTRNLNVLIR